MSKLLLIILSILLPPLAVFLQKGLTGTFWLNVLLTIIGIFALGVIHALYVTLVEDEAIA